MWLRWIYQILLDERGQEAPAAGGEGQGGAPADGGEGTPPGAGEGGAGEGGQGAEPPATPAFGDFGDTPTTLEEATALLQTIYGEHSKIKPEFETLKGKTSATERNLALTRQALESSGIRAVQDEEGNIRLEVVNKPAQEKKIRFNDEAINKLAFHFQNSPQSAKEFVDLIRLAIQDELDSGFDARQQQYQEGMRRQTIFNRFYDQATGLMFAHFPQLDGKWDASGKTTNEAFDQAFHDKVMEKIKEKYSDGRGHLTNPQGELLAALEVAQELGITAQAVSKAKQEGFQAGKTGKKILGPVGGGGKGGTAKPGKLSFAEYDKLSPEKKKEYDENWKEA